MKQTRIIPSTNIAHQSLFNFDQAHNSDIYSLEMVNTDILPIIDTLLPTLPPLTRFLFEFDIRNTKEYLRALGIEFETIGGWAILNISNMRYLSLVAFTERFLCIAVEGPITLKLIGDITHNIQNGISPLYVKGVFSALEFIGENNKNNTSSLYGHFHTPDMVTDFAAAHIIFILESLYPHLKIVNTPSEFYLNQLGRYFKIDIGHITKCSSAIRIPLLDCENMDEIWLDLPSQKWSFQ